MGVHSIIRQILIICTYPQCSKIEKIVQFQLCVQLLGGYTITSKAKINSFLKNLHYSRSSFGAAPFENFSKTLILTCEANSALSHQFALSCRILFVKSGFTNYFTLFSSHIYIGNHRRRRRKIQSC